jgi:hypothetical protein
MSELITNLEPFAVRPKEGARLAGCSLSLFYRRLSEGVYETFLDGFNRLVTVESIKAHQKKQLAVARVHQPAGRQSAVPAKLKPKTKVW